MPFTFKALGPCGGTITATLQLQDGATNLGMVNFTLPLGQFQLATTFTENFDEMTPPALPSGWSSTFTGAETNWFTSSNSFDTYPNAAYASEPPNPGLAWL